MPPEGPRVLIGGYYGFDNAGDEAILAALLDDLRALAPSLSAVVASGDPDGTAAAHGVDTVRWNDVPALIKAAEAADLIVLGGGGLFHDYWPFPDAVLTRDAYGISYFAGFPLLGSLLGKPVAFYALGVGPLTTLAGRKSTRAAFEQANVITVRDTGSRDELAALGIEPSRVHVTADPAFGLRPEPPERAAALLDQAGLAEAGRLRLGVALRQWDVGVDGRVWTETVAQALDSALDKGDVELIFVPFQGLRGDLLDDVALAHRVRSRLRHATRTVALDGRQTAREKAAVLASCHAVLGMRLHSLIFALTGGVPSVALAYDPKVRAALAEAGVKADIFDLGALDAQALAISLRGALEADGAQRTRLAEAAVRLAVRARENAHLALGLLQAPPPSPGPALPAARAAALSQSRRLYEVQGALAQRETELQQLARAHETAVQAGHEALAALRAELAGPAERLRAIESGWGGVLLRRVGAVRQAIAPEGSRRRLLLLRSLAWLRLWRREGWGPALRRLAVPAAATPEASPAVALLDPAPVARANAYDVVCFPIIDWEFRFQRPQQLLSRFAAAGHRVFYVATGFRPEGPPYTLRPLAPNVYEVSLRGPTRSLYTDGLDGAGAVQVFAALDALRRDLGLGATVQIVDLPFWWPVAQMARERLAWPVVYDCMDHHAGFGNVGPAVLEQEASLLTGADLVCAASSALFASCRAANANTLLVPNGCDFDHFAAVPPPLTRPRPVIGYYGAIAEWFDSDLVADLAQRRPEWDFVLVGSTYRADLTRLGALPNVTLAGEQPYTDLPRWIATFDVLLLPFKRLPLTEATNPVKLYEILAAGRPLVSVPLPEVAAHADLVSLASTAEEFDRAVAAALVESPARAAAGREFARGQTWQGRFEALEPYVRQAFPLLSIVVVTYNNSTLNRQCLDSVYERTEWPHFELVVVDNASTDGTPAVLEAAARRHPHLAVVLNDTNRGFAAANNQGLALAGGRFLVLLNNDTLVTRGWAAALLRHLHADPTLGLVGPVTNAISNAARVTVGYERVEDLLAWAAGYVREHDDELFDIPMLAMFCVALRREVWEAVGPLDERFAVGMFEDDDYNTRVRQRGLRIACARDSFVHHWQRSSFKLLGEGEYQRIFDENKRRYEEKWQRAWDSSGIELAGPAAGGVGALPEEVCARLAGARGAVVFPPTIGWEVHLVQRPHHLARAFARAGYVVVFDSSNGQGDWQGFREVERNLFVYRGAPRGLAGIRGATLWTLPYNFHQRADHPGAAAVVYDWIDDLAVFPHDVRLLEANHARALREAAVVACVARRLHQAALESRADALYLPNGVDYEHFAGVPAGPQADPRLAALREAGRSVAGYYGALAAWFDYALLEEASRRRPDWTFVLIGPSLDGSLEGQPLLQRPNVLWTGTLAYEALPACLALFDVALIPFRINPITVSTSPLKLYEYFAGGRPVVATPMPECMAYPEVRVVSDAADLAAALDPAGEDGRDAAFVERVRTVARANTWDQRAAAALAALGHAPHTEARR